MSETNHCTKIVNSKDDCIYDHNSDNSMSTSQIVCNRIAFLRHHDQPPHPQCHKSTHGAHDMTKENTREASKEGKKPYTNPWMTMRDTK